MKLNNTLFYWSESRSGEILDARGLCNINGVTEEPNNGDIFILIDKYQTDEVDLIILMYNQNTATYSEWSERPFERCFREIT